jgi:hypothetical protein
MLGELPFLLVRSFSLLSRAWVLRELPSFFGWFVIAITELKCIIRFLDSSHAAGSVPLNYLNGCKSRYLTVRVCKVP